MCLWFRFRGACGIVQPRHTCPSLVSMCASSSTCSLVLMRSRSRLLVASGSRVVSLCLSRCFGSRQGWGLGIPQPFRGCRKGCRYPRHCPGLRGSSGQGAWHPLAPSWVPRPFFFSRSPRVSVSVVGAPFCSGVRVFLEPPCHRFPVAKVFVPRLLNQC